MFRKDTQRVEAEHYLSPTNRPEDTQYTGLKARRHLVLQLRHPEACDGNFVYGKREAIHNRIQAFTRSFKSWPELANC